MKKSEVSYFYSVTLDYKDEWQRGCQVKVRFLWKVIVASVVLAEAFVIVLISYTCFLTRNLSSSLLKAFRVGTRGPI